MVLSRQPRQRGKECRESWPIGGPIRGPIGGGAYWGAYQGAYQGAYWGRGLLGQGRPGQSSVVLDRAELRTPS